jgi:hypothetical protein
VRRSSTGTPGCRYAPTARALQEVLRIHAEYSAIVGAPDVGPDLRTITHRAAERFRRNLRASLKDFRPVPVRYAGVVGPAAVMHPLGRRRTVSPVNDGRAWAVAGGVVASDRDLTRAAVRDITFAENASQGSHRHRPQPHGLPAQPRHRPAQPRRPVSLTAALCHHARDPA